MEDKRPADSALVPRVSSAAVFAYLLICLISRCSVYAFILPSVLLSSVSRVFSRSVSLSFTQSLSPSIVFADFFLMNLILWVEGSSAAIPFGTLVAILALWFGISVPLTFVGAYFGFKKAVSRDSQLIPLFRLT